MDTWSTRRRKLLSLTLVFPLLTSSSLLTDGLIRLAGSTQCSGRVEISHDNAWGTVCDDGWDLNDAMVVCRELGCGAAQKAPIKAHFGEGTGNIWLDEVACSGNENYLTECLHAIFGKHDCTHSEDAGVNCSGQLPVPRLFAASSALLPGEDLILTCSVSSQFSIPLKISFYKDGVSRYEQTIAAQQTNGVINLSNADSTHQGKYSCNYSTQRATSSTSRTVSVTVVRLQQPNISLVSPETGLIWAPAGAQVTVGHSFVITCSLSSPYPGGLFILIFSGSNSTDTKPEVDGLASFNVSVAEYKHQGNYSCVYEIQLSLRNFTTTKSKPISVIIKPTLVLSVSLAGAGALLLLLLVLVVVCLVRGRRAKESGAHDHTQMTGRVMNHYEESDKEEEEDEEEADYVNVEPGDLKKKQTQLGVEGEEESDEDHDYEEAQSDAHRDYVDGDETYVFVEDSRDEVKHAHAFIKDEEEEEEEGSDADDYVNGPQAFIENVVEIYEGEEYIYESIQ